MQGKIVLEEHLSSELNNSLWDASGEYPYENMATASEWFGQALLSENDREKIGRGNAVRLFQF